MYLIENKELVFRSSKGYPYLKNRENTLNMLHPDYYFSLESFFLTPLLKEVFIYDVLKKLPMYIANQKLGKIDIIIPENVYLENSHLISIGEGTIIEPGVYIKGPAIIGKNCKICHGAYIRENVILGDESVVGHNSEIKNSILFPRAHAAHFNYVGDSILGFETNLGAGVKCANLRFDKKEIILHIKEKKINTGLRKFGVILGDRSQIGCNSVTNPGTLIGMDVFCPPGIVIKGLISSKTKITSHCMYSIEKEN